MPAASLEHIGVLFGRTALLFALSLVCVNAASAQQAIELGVDAGVQLAGNGTDLEQTSWQLPVSAVRIAAHTGDHLSFEGAVSVNRTSFDDFDQTTVTAFELLSMALYHFGSDRSRRRVHLLLGVPIRYASASNSSGSYSDTEFGLIVGGIGLTLPVADHLGLRFQARGIGWEGSTTRLSFLVGFSYLSAG